jgi:hypothetical protein
MDESTFDAITRSVGAAGRAEPCYGSCRGRARRDDNLMPPQVRRRSRVTQRGRSAALVVGPPIAPARRSSARITREQAHSAAGTRKGRKTNTAAVTATAARVPELHRAGCGTGRVWPIRRWRGALSGADRVAITVSQGSAPPLINLRATTEHAPIGASARRKPAPISDPPRLCLLAQDACCPGQKNVAVALHSASGCCDADRPQCGACDTATCTNDTWGCGGTLRQRAEVWGRSRPRPPAVLGRSHVAVAGASRSGVAG